MRSHPENASRRLLTLKHAQQALAHAAAQAELQDAQTKRADAQRLRDDAAATVDAAMPSPEGGLTRSMLYDRLRTLAVARAHALETIHAAMELEENAGQCETRARELKAIALVHQRKYAKLDVWQSRHRCERARNRERRYRNQQQEDLACRRR